MDTRPRSQHRFASRPKRGRLAVYVALLACAVVAMLMMRQCSTPGPFSASQVGHSGGDTIDVAIEYGPTTLYRYNDTLGGMAYDMLREMAADTLPMKFHPVTSGARALELLASGAVDLVVAEIPRTTDYDSVVAFTEPVYLDRQVLVQRTDSADSARYVKSVLDLAGRQVTVSAGSPMLHRLQNLSAEIGDTILINTDSIHGPEQLVIMTAIGDIEMTVVNNRVARRIAADYPALDVSTNISFTQFQSWMMHSDSTRLHSLVDSLIVRYRRSPRYERLIDRYGM